MGNFSDDSKQPENLHRKIQMFWLEDRPIRAPITGERLV